MVYGHSETDVRLDEKRQEVNARLARETRIGWPTLTIVAVLIVFGATIALYLALGACSGRY
ncbi:hypothetical protein MicloDRAFT_00050480 [Microvirga lotononidis]|uniref:Uncharacterized protein n=1 Tax=Microvirga lotononidis TaxID=864069 RepID=I4YWX1_9HYPH|nr:hypothetical protein MicloDRAFT_00050480 [Microvirga lotononidis]